MACSSPRTMGTLAAAGRRTGGKTLNPYSVSLLIRQQKDPVVALKLFENPNPDADPKKPFRRSYLSYDLVVERLGRARMFPEMERVISMMKSERPRFVPKEPLFCNVIRSYGRSRLPGPAIRTFDSMPSFGCKRTARSVNSLLNALFNCRQFEKIRDLQDNLNSLCVPDACTYNILIKACCSNDSIGEARDLLSEMIERRIRPNGVTFGTLISYLCRRSDLDAAFRLKEEMWRIHHLEPTLVVYTSLIKGLCVANDLPAAFRLKEEMEASGIVSDAAVYATLMTGLFRSGRREKVDAVMKEMKANGCEADTVFYNSMINGFCKNGDFDAAFSAFDEMVGKKLKPDVFTFNTLIGSLCAAGRVRDAMDVFEDMPRWECLPDVVTYRMVFDGLCDAGELEDAAFLLDEMLFKSFIPHGVNLKKFIDSICKTCNLKLLESILTSVSSTAADLPMWEVAIQRVCGNCDRDELCRLLDSIAEV
ncbi:putative pentatricopeptide repeat-containing protein [Nymphaea thermarum]|nr:putative pentatricopeptide repeat-containing protein [Nymphaea thermarum]